MHQQEFLKKFRQTEKIMAGMNYFVLFVIYVLMMFALAMIEV